MTPESEQLDSEKLLGTQKTEDHECNSARSSSATEPWPDEEQSVALKESVCTSKLGKDLTNRFRRSRPRPYRHRFLACRALFRFARLLVAVTMGGLLALYAHFHPPIPPHQRATKLISPTVMQSNIHRTPLDAAGPLRRGLLRLPRGSSSALPVVAGLPRHLPA